MCAGLYHKATASSSSVRTVAANLDELDTVRDGADYFTYTWLR